MLRASVCPGVPLSALQWHRSAETKPAAAQRHTQIRLSPAMSDSTTWRTRWQWPSKPRLLSALQQEGKQQATHGTQFSAHKPTRLCQVQQCCLPHSDHSKAAWPVQVQVSVSCGEALTRAAQPGLVVGRTRYDRLAILVAKLRGSIAIEDVGCAREVVQPHKAPRHGGPRDEEAREESPQEVAQPAHQTRPCNATHCHTEAAEVLSTISLTLRPVAAEPSCCTVALHHRPTVVESHDCSVLSQLGLPRRLCQVNVHAWPRPYHSTIEACSYTYLWLFVCYDLDVIFIIILIVLFYSTAASVGGFTSSWARRVA